MNEIVAAIKAGMPTTGITEFSISAIVTVAAAALGKIPFILVLFLCATITDYATGWIKAKYFLHEWNSKEGLNGAIKKVMYFVLIGTAFLIGYSIKELGTNIEQDLNFAMLLGWYTTAVMLVNEFTSILENLYVIMPDKVPVWLIKSLKIADKQLDKKINDIVCKGQNCNKCDLKERCNLKKEEEKANE